MGSVRKQTGKTGRPGEGRCFTWSGEMYYLVRESVVDRYTVAPPQLPADAPVLDVLKPPVVDLLKPLWNNLDVAILNSLHDLQH